MTLGFATKWPARMGDLAGQPNNFVNKIWAGLIQGKEVPAYGEALYEWGVEARDIVGVAPKIHTIREDPHNRWRPGMKIHPVSKNRTKDRFQFAPVLKCTGVQKIEIHRATGLNSRLYSYVKVDGRQLNWSEIETLAVNDGFPSVEAFFMWFNKDFSGKIIHWTDLRY